jgi:hypothetical protein
METDNVEEVPKKPRKEERTYDSEETEAAPSYSQATALLSSKGKKEWKTASTRHTERRHRRIPEKLCFLTDSQGSGIVRDAALEAALIREGNDGRITILPGGRLEHSLKAKVKTEDAGTMVIIGFPGNDLDSREWNKLKDEEEEERYLEHLADQMEELINRFTTLGMKVVYVLPPIRENSDRKAELRFEQKMEERDVSNCTLVCTPTMMQRKMEKNGWSDTRNMYNPHDGIHLCSYALMQLIELGLNVFGLKLRYNEKDTLTDVYKMLGRRKTKGGIKRCHGCGGNHIRQECTRGKLWCRFCERDDHNPEACCSQNRICGRCGLNSLHERRPCRENDWYRK